MDRFFNSVKLHAMGLAMQGAETRIGIVTSYDPVDASARVKIMPEGVLTGWIPVASVAVGAVSIVAPPNIGDQVVLQPQEGDAEHWIVTGRLFNTVDMPPKGASTNAAIPSGELAIVGQNGACLHVKADGSWWMKGDLHVDGNILATGDISDKNLAHGTVDTFRTQYNTHAHTGVQSGGSTTNVTNHTV